MGTFAKIEDRDEMPHNVAFHQGLCCLPRQKRERNTILIENFNM